MNARERSRVETRKRLIEKATELFSERGVVNTRAFDIALSAGVAVGTLYLHFKDKHGLLRAILFEGVEDLLASLRSLSEAPSDQLAKSVRIHTETLVRFAEEHRPLCRILFDSESIRSNVRTEIQEYLVLMQEKRLHEAIENGIVPGDLDARVASEAIVGMLIRVLDWWTRDPSRATREAVVETLTRLRLSGLYRI